MQLSRHTIYVRKYIISPLCCSILQCLEVRWCVLQCAADVALCCGGHVCRLLPGHIWDGVQCVDIYVAVCCFLHRGKNSPKLAMPRFTIEDSYKAEHRAAVGVQLSRHTICVRKHIISPNPDSLFKIAMELTIGKQLM